MAIAFMAVTVLANEVIFDFSTVEGLQAMGITAPAQSSAVNLTDVGAITVDGVNLTAINGTTETRVWNSQGSYSLRIYVGGSITLAVENGSITGVTINAASTSNFDLLTNVGSYSTTGNVGIWTGSTSSVTFLHGTSKNAQIASIVVTTSEEDPIDNPGGDPGPVDPNILRLDSLANIETLDDGTDFQFTTKAYVQYQWGDYLWLMQLDDEYYAYAAMVYGNVSQYPVGAVIPAGWTGKKTTYKGLVEIVEPAHFNAATEMVDEMFTEPFDMTGYMSYIEPDHYENMRVKFNGITLSDIDSSGNFTINSNEEDAEGNPITVTMAGYNKFGIDYPAVDPTERYNIDGMVTIYNNNYQLYPITIEEAPGTRLWKVTYEGLEGNMKLADSLYVVMPLTDNQILVTDNATEILVDTYAEWGYTWYQDWYPTWVALDCGNDTELFNAIRQMQVLAPNTVKGEMVDVATNPRMILSSEPTGITDPDFTEYHTYTYNLSYDKIKALGNELAMAHGKYNLINGEPYLCSAEDTVMVRLDFSLNPELQNVLSPGTRYEMMSVFKVNEPWNAEEYAAVPQRSFKAAASKAMKAPALKVYYNDADYYTNYTIMPVSAEIVTAIDSINASKQVTRVSYVSPTGIVSDAPSPGLNIVITQFNDSTRIITKVLK